MKTNVQAYVLRNEMSIQVSTTFSDHGMEIKIQNFHDTLQIVVNRGIKLHKTDLL
jgi:hypothetical protein